MMYVSKKKLKDQVFYFQVVTAVMSDEHIRDKATTHSEGLKLIHETLKIFLKQYCVI